MTAMQKVTDQPMLLLWLQGNYPDGTHGQWEICPNDLAEALEISERYQGRTRYDVGEDQPEDFTANGFFESEDYDLIIRGAYLSLLGNSGHIVYRIYDDRI